MRIAFVRTKHLPYLGTHCYIGIIPFNSLDQLIDSVDEITDPSGCEYIILKAGESIFFDRKINKDEEEDEFSEPSKSHFSECLHSRINFDDNKWKDL